jgi:hypothetical protein
VSFLLTNGGPDPADYTVDFDLYDRTGVQVAAFGVAVGLQLDVTEPGGKVRYAGPHGMRVGSVPADFTCRVISVERLSA